MKRFKRFKRLKNTMALTLALSLTRCGYVSDSPPKNVDIYKTDALNACKIDLNQLSDIFTADQKEQIRCIEENLIQFTKYVRSKSPGSINEKELNTFVRKFFEGKSDSIVEGLSLIFQLNMVLLKDEADRISRSNITPLFDLLVKVNQEAIVITQILKAMEQAENQSRFFEYREHFLASVTRFSEFTVKIIEKSKGTQQKLHIKDFLLEASKKIGNNGINPQTIDTLLFLKSVLVAGDKEIITSNEIREIIVKLPKILTLAFDFYFVNNSNFTNEIDHTRFYLGGIRNIYSLINFNQPNFELFTLDQILKLAQEFIKDVDVLKFKPSLEALKKRIIGGNGNSYTLVDLKNIIDIGHDFFERMYFNTVTYQFYQEVLEKNQPILALPPLELPKYYDVFNKKRMSELHLDFESIAVNIRYFRSKKDGVAYYGHEFSRNFYGFKESALFKWLSTKLLQAYGHNNAQGARQVSLAEFETFLFEMKPILVQFQLWSPTPQTFARNSVLLADLFQNKSDGDLEVNIIEATEYIQMILTATEITNKLKIDLPTLCDGGINQKDPVFETECFNKHFFEVLITRYTGRFPQLAKYVDPKNTSARNVIRFLLGVEGFARDNPDLNIPINKRDSILITGALLNIESTFIRYDTDKNNILDYDELVEAFKVYKFAIISMAKLKAEDEEYALSIFLYMVSKMEIPPTGSWMQSLKFFAFHKCLSNSFCRNKILDEISGQRLNIGKLLFYIVNQNGVSNYREKYLQQLKNDELLHR